MASASSYRKKARSPSCDLKFIMLTHLISSLSLATFFPDIHAGISVFPASSSDDYFVRLLFAIFNQCRTLLMKTAVLQSWFTLQSLQYMPLLWHASSVRIPWYLIWTIRSLPGITTTFLILFLQWPAVLGKSKARQLVVCGSS